MWPFTWMRLSRPPGREDPLALPPAPDWMVAEIGRLTGWDPERCRRVLQSATTEEYVAAGGESPNEDFSRSDPLEQNPAFAAALLRAELEAEVAADRSYGQGEMGYCHAFWGEKQRILWERYGLRWQSPPQLNPDVEFD